MVYLDNNGMKEFFCHKQLISQADIYMRDYLKA